MADIEWLREKFARKFRQQQEAEDALRLAYQTALHARIEALGAERDLHEATGKYTEKQRRELDDQIIYLMRKRDSPYQHVRTMLEAGKFKRLMGI